MRYNVWQYKPGRANVWRVGSNLTKEEAEQVVKDCPDGLARYLKKIPCTTTSA